MVRMKKIQNFFSTILQKLWKSPIKAKENMEGGNNMKKRATTVPMQFLVQDMAQSTQLSAQMVERK